MITICPKCALTLTVSAADLRIAQGQVRCGRCLAVFNALLALYDEPPGRKTARSDKSERSAPERSAPERITPERSATLERVENFESTTVLRRVEQTTLIAEALPGTEAAPQSAAVQSAAPEPVAAAPEEEQHIQEPAHDALPEPEPAPQPLSQQHDAAPPEDTPSQIIAREIITAGLVDEAPVSSTADTGVNPALAGMELPVETEADPAATDVGMQLASSTTVEVSVPVSSADELQGSLADEMPEAANEELIEDLPAANDPFIAEPQVDATPQVAYTPEVAANSTAIDDDGIDLSGPAAEAPLADAPAADAAATDLPVDDLPASNVHATNEPALTEAVADTASAAFAHTAVADSAATAGSPAQLADVEGIDLAAPDEDFGTVRVIVPAAIAAAATAPGPSGPVVEPLFRRSTDRVPEPPAELALVEPPPPADSDAVAVSDLTDDDIEAQLETPAPRRYTALWAAGVAVCTLLLGAQLVHVNRNALALNPNFGPAVRSLYAKLGMPIAPHWEVGAYDVRQQGAVAGADATAPLTVRASILNRAAHEQPMPLLRVTLQDRFGNRIALRDLQPREYLPAAKPGGKVAATLAAGQRVDAEVAMADPGGKAVGFEIDACLQVAPGRYLCANDQAAEHATTSAAR